MKKITITLFLLVIGAVTLTISAQKKLVNWTAGIDSVATDEQIKEWTFYYGGPDEFLTKDRKPKTITTKKNKPVISDNRVLILQGTEGRIEDIKRIPVDSFFVPGSTQKVYTYKKVYYLRLEKDAQETVVLPFTAGVNPTSKNNFTLDLQVGKSFTYDGHFFELFQGSATLQVSAKLLDDLKKASGYGF